MKLVIKIASRYIISKKKQNVINIISYISSFGIIIATIAVVCILSIFNGFSSKVEETFSSFDADIKISSVLGKVFIPTINQYQSLNDLEGLEYIEESLEENALLKFSDRQKIVTLKGISENGSNFEIKNEIIIDGIFDLGSKEYPSAIFGGGIAYELGVRPGFVDPVEIFIPKRNATVNLVNPASSYNKSKVFTSGVFSINQVDYDNQFVITSIDLLRKLLNYENEEVSSLNLQFSKKTNIENTKKKISQIMGDDFVVRNKTEQHIDMYKMINIEKWVTFSILFIIISIAIFNLVGSLTMLIIEKKEDIKTLKYIGASNTFIKKIFIAEGVFTVFFGVILGIVLGLILCLAQEQFGIIKLSGNKQLLVFDAYPVVVKWFDIVVVFFSITLIGLASIMIPIKSLNKNLIHLTYNE